MVTPKNPAQTEIPTADQSTGTAKPATGTVQPGPVAQPPGEIGGREGPEPTRFGDWEVNGRCTDF
ncbi:DUF1674 domain-containing protein [Niveispirillum irakense]|uniref:DUF1674 domain-containing protein n=1 Tax=Niveispirillum irakense TaxID=34011 RepID=UPI000415FE77|nr:succinate dehydrogenase assembly factor 4 [Niveispirillum irakense]